MLYYIMVWNGANWPTTSSLISKRQVEKHNSLHTCTSPNSLCLFSLVLGSNIMHYYAGNFSSYFPSASSLPYVSGQNCKYVASSSSFFLLVQEIDRCHLNCKASELTFSSLSKENFNHDALCNMPQQGTPLTCFDYHIILQLRRHELTCLFLHV